MSRLLLRLAALLIALSAWTTAASSQVLFRAELDGANLSPPPPTEACGWSRWELLPDGSVSYDVRVRAMTGTGAELRLGTLPATGPVVASLAGGPTEWTGATAPLSAADQDALRAGDLHVVVTSAAEPDGEIGGQVGIEHAFFSAFCTASQVVPATTATSIGELTFVLQEDGSAIYVLSATTDGTAASIRRGVPGVEGPEVVALEGSGPAWIGTTAPFAPDDLDALQRGELYVELETAAFPDGELRGQILVDGIPYLDDAGCAPLRLELNGALTNGATVFTVVSGGAPGSIGWLLVALAPDMGTLNFEPFLLDPGSIVLDTIVLPLGAGGSLGIPTVVPPLGGDGSIFLQFFGLDPSAANGKFDVSNGVEARLVALP